ncbi:MAG: recombination protein RecR [Phycisphaeraceae bacterium]|nr:recombination protein RecR [Phycisphaeraceae bacterium]
MPSKQRDNQGSARNGSAYPEPVERLIETLARLPGIGRRTAERLAFYVLKSPAEEADRLAAALRDVKRAVRHCRVCYNLTQSDPCPICADGSRDRASVLIVEQPKDCIALEQTGVHRGLYHVLMGRISPLDGVTPAHLTIDDLLARFDDPSRNPGGVRPTEAVLGLNPTLEGDGTALYLAGELRKRGVAVTRLARGLPSGGQLEYVSRAVLADAIAGRQRME